MIFRGNISVRDCTRTKGNCHAIIVQYVHDRLTSARARFHTIQDRPVIGCPSQKLNAARADSIYLYCIAPRIWLVWDDHATCRAAFASASGDKNYLDNSH